MSEEQQESSADLETEELEETTIKTKKRKRTKFSKQTRKSSNSQRQDQNTNDDDLDDDLELPYPQQEVGKTQKEFLCQDDNDEKMHVDVVEDPAQVTVVETQIRRRQPTVKRKHEELTASCSSSEETQIKHISKEDDTDEGMRALTAPIEDFKQTAEDVKAFFLLKKAETCMTKKRSKKDSLEACNLINELKPPQSKSPRALILKAVCMIKTRSPNQAIDVIEELAKLDVPNLKPIDVFKFAKECPKTVVDGVETAVVVYRWAAELYASHPLFHVAECIKGIRNVLFPKIQNSTKRMKNQSKKPKATLDEDVAIGICVPLMLKMLQLQNRKTKSQGEKDIAMDQAFSLYYISSTYSKLDKFEEAKKNAKEGIGVLEEHHEEEIYGRLQKELGYVLYRSRDREGAKTACLCAKEVIQNAEMKEEKRNRLLESIKKTLNLIDS